MSTKGNAGQYIDTTEIDYRERDFRKGERGRQQGCAQVCMLQCREEKMAEKPNRPKSLFPFDY